MCTKEYYYLEKVKDKDIFTYNHLIRLKNIVKNFGNFLKLNKEEKKCLEISALYHDAGKLFISNDILNKPDKLTKEEFDLMKNHTKYGLLKLSEVPKGYQEVVEDSMLNHHYLNGYSVSEPTPLTKIIAITDMYEAMTSKRPYKEPFTPEKSLELLNNLYVTRKEDKHIFDSFKEFILLNEKK